ncbi:glycosyltransferase [Agrococcus sp. TF02-05]|uniref:glycosyltransferase n=1 Tax=Agrococcus sp. TF02-05 TaxID=2815211 RepID=UPI001AA0D598|nr:glycosyltransferase [Agrococcus sp. TF02-05]MBO1770714.1 glycosyltransferase family 2 protein [Agrococcus sp. TF02-05]
MHPRVFVVLAASDGAEYLPATLDAIAAQRVAPHALVAVDGGSKDASRGLLEGSGARSVVIAPRLPFGQLIARGVAALPPAEEGDWLWLLAHDAAPHPRALQALLSHVDVHESVALVGPKLMRADSPDRFAEFGQSMTRFGRSLLLREGELDQGQRDDDSDTLGVAETGMLVRRDVFDALGGFDPVLRSIDAGLDLGVRARLAGHRVALEPRARARRAGGPEHFAARAVSDAQRVGIARRAQLHRRLAYANPVALVLHWLLLLPLAALRTLGHLLAKRPAAVLAEWRATLAALVSIAPVARARRRIARSRTERWSALRGLRVPWRAMRLQRRAVGDPAQMRAVPVERVGFVEGAGLWVTALAVVIGLVLSPQLITAGAATGGALLPLPGSLGNLWASVLGGQRDALGAVHGAADPFALVLAVLGSLTPWRPSTAIVLLLLLAPAIASVVAFFAARRLTGSRWAPAVAAAVWALSPTLLLAITEGRLGAVVAHLALPLAVVGMLRAHRSWRAAGAAAIPLALVVASAPVLVPAMALLVVLAASIGWRSPLRPLLAALPAVALMAPIVVERWRAGVPLAALADPGVPFPSEPPTALEAALAAPDGTLATLETAVSAMAPGVAAGWIALGLLAPLALAALAGVVLRPARAWPAVLLLVAGYGTAVLASRLAVATLEGESVAVWAGTGASLMLLALVVLAALAVDVDDRVGAVPGGIVALAAVAGALPVVASSFLAPATVVPAPERRMPAFVEAAAAEDPGVGTLVLRPLAEDVLRVEVERGLGETLDRASTARHARESPDPVEEELAQAAVDLASGADVDVSELLDGLGVRFVLVEQEREGAAGLHDRAQRSLDARGDLQAIGQTQAGLLWQRMEAAASTPSPAPAWAGWLLAAQLTAIVGAIVAALPSLRRGARVRTKRLEGAEAWQ